METKNKENDMNSLRAGENSKPKMIKITWRNYKGKKVERTLKYNSYHNTVDFGIAILPATRDEISKYLKAWGCELISIETQEAEA